MAASFRYGVTITGAVLLVTGTLCFAWWSDGEVGPTSNSDAMAVPHGEAKVVPNSTSSNALLRSVSFFCCGIGGILLLFGLLWSVKANARGMSRHYQYHFSRDLHYFTVEPPDKRTYRLLCDLTLSRCMFSLAALVMSSGNVAVISFTPEGTTSRQTVSLTGFSFCVMTPRTEDHKAQILLQESVQLNPMAEPHGWAEWLLFRLPVLHYCDSAWDSNAIPTYEEALNCRPAQSPVGYILPCGGKEENTPPLYEDLDEDDTWPGSRRRSSSDSVLLRTMSSRRETESRGEPSATPPPSYEDISVRGV